MSERELLKRIKRFLQQYDIINSPVAHEARLLIQEINEVLLRQ